MYHIGECRGEMAEYLGYVGNLLFNLATMNKNPSIVRVRIGLLA